MMQKGRSKMKLYEIRSELEFVLDSVQVDEETGEILGASDTLDKIEKNLEEKALNTAKYIKNQLAEAKAIREEEIELADRRKVIENKAEYWKKYLAYNLKGEKYQDSQVAISWLKSQSIVIDPNVVISTVYSKVKIEPDKVKMKKAIKSGEKINGVELITKSNIQIK